MRSVHLISLIALVALIVTVLLGVLFWIAQSLSWIALLSFFTQINLTSIHDGVGFIGVLGLLILGCVAISTRGMRLLGVGGVIYALLVPIFGLTQVVIDVGSSHWLIRAAHLLVGIGAIYLIRRIEKRYQRLREAFPRTTVFQAT